MNKFNLTVLRELSDNGLIGALFGDDGAQNSELRARLLAQIYAASAEENLTECVQQIILRDENPFSLTCAHGGTPSRYLKKAYADDVRLIMQKVNSLSAEGKFCIGESLDLFKQTETLPLTDTLEIFYRENGCGNFIGGKAYAYSDGRFTAIKHTSEITLGDLKDYHNERALIENNICDFLHNLPYSNMLLYGERGTGKSSTVHAMLNKYCGRGLRLVEIGKEQIKDLKAIEQAVHGLSLKFIVFIDDLSIDGQGDSLSALKAAVEGSVGGSDNIMIVATSNRRHIVRESFGERNDSVHPADSMEELLSLSDRFGLTVLFSSTDKASYLSIVRQLADDRKLTTPAVQLEALAERWALQNGGRSPRRARQFTDFAYACEQSGRPIDF